MRKRSYLYLGIFLVILGLSLLGVSNITIAGSKTVEVCQGNFVWSVTGHFNRDEKMTVVVEAANNWSSFVGLEGRTVLINVSITGPDDGRVDFVSNFYAYLDQSFSVSTPLLLLRNASTFINAGSSNVAPLSVDKIQDYIGGIANEDGNFTVIVDEQSILSNFGSTSPPRRISLDRKDRDSFPYASLLPFGVVSAVSGFGSVVYGLHTKKRKRFEKR
jgi:hypothetical protein